MTDVLIRKEREQQQKGHVNPQWECNHLYTKERDLRRNQKYQHLNMYFYPIELWNNKFLLFKQLSLQYYILLLASSQQIHSLKVCPRLTMSSEVSIFYSFSRLCSCRLSGLYLAMLFMNQVFENYLSILSYHFL